MTGRQWRRHPRSFAARPRRQSPGLLRRGSVSPELPGTRTRIDKRNRTRSEPPSGHLLRSGLARCDPKGDCETQGMVVVGEYGNVHELGGQDCLTQRNRFFGAQPPKSVSALNLRLLSVGVEIMDHERDSTCLPNRLRITRVSRLVMQTSRRGPGGAQAARWRASFCAWLPGRRAEPGLPGRLRPTSQHRGTSGRPVRGPRIPTQAAV